MATALALRSSHFDRTVLLRGALAGTAWGLALSAGFVGIALAQCGRLPYPDGVALTTLVCVATGLVTMGPFAAFGKREA